MPTAAEQNLKHDDDGFPKVLTDCDRQIKKHCAIAKNNIFFAAAAVVAAAAANPDFFKIRLKIRD